MVHHSIFAVCPHRVGGGLTSRRKKGFGLGGLENRHSGMAIIISVIIIIIIIAVVVVRVVVIMVAPGVV